MKYILVLCLVFVICNAFQSFSENNEVIEPEEHRYDQNRTKWPGRRPHFPFIVNGTAAALGDVPWYVSIVGTYVCGGSILNKRTIISAAHCFVGEVASKLSVRYGSLRLNSGGTVVGVTRIIQNPNYGKSSNEDENDYDISLLILKADIKLNNNTVKAISLPAQDSDPKEGTNVLVAGLGRLTEGGSTPSTLQKVVLQIVERRTCKSDYEFTPYVITERMICAEAPGKDSCQGDSGGPLTINGTNIQVGVVSFGEGCARPDFPGVYSRVSKLLDFINKNKAK